MFKYVVTQDERLFQNKHPEIYKIGSLHCESLNINTTERSVGLPVGTASNFFYEPTSITQLQISSSSANDTSAGTGARTVLITGLYQDSTTSKWIEQTETLIMNGQTAVSSTNTNWIRINRMDVITSGSGQTNAGDIYLSVQATSLTAGVPASNILNAIITGFNNSTSGNFYVPSGYSFYFTKGNCFFLNDNNNRILLRERYSIGTSSTRPIYHIAYYPMGSVSYDYTGSSAYLEKTNINLSIFKDTGTTNKPGSYFIEYVLVNNSSIDNTISTF